MKNKWIPFGAFWLASVAGAFVVGYSLHDADDGTELSQRPENQESGKPKAETPGNGRQSSGEFETIYLEVENESSTGPKLDAVSLLRKAITSTDPVDRLRTLADALKGITPENAREIAAIFEEMPRNPARMQEWSLLMSAWGAVDGPGALAYTQEMEDSRAGRWGAMTALSGWARTDPQAALAWAQENKQEDGNDRGGRGGPGFDPYMMGVLNGWAANDPDGAAQYVREITAESGNNRYIDMITTRYLEQGLPTATRWADSLPNDEFKAEAMQDIARHWANQDPKQAAGWISKYAGTEGSQDAISTVAREWAQENPQEAISWASALPEGTSRSDGIAAAVRSWADDDPAAAGEWLNTQPKDASLDSAVSAFAREIVRDDPEAAIGWAATISDPQARENSIVDVVQQVARRDPDSAATMLEGVEISAEAKEKALTPPQRGGFDFRNFRGGQGGGGGR